MSAPPLKTGKSVRAAVDQINENISNAVPELVLLLITLQDRCTPPPPTTASSVEAVAKSADVLAGIAEQLAKTEYTKWPTVQAEINAAAREVADNARGLRKAMADLGRGDLAAGYTRLMESTRVIGGTCIKVLAVVYGASFSRMNLQFKLADEEVAALDTRAAESAPKKFVEDLSKAVTDGNQLAAFIRQQADAEDSEVVQKDLRDAADMLERAGDDVIARCNEFTSDFGDPERQAADRELANYRKALSDAMRPVHDRERELADQTAAALRAAGKRVAAVPRTGRTAVPQSADVRRGDGLGGEFEAQRAALQALDDLVGQGRQAEAAQQAKAIAARQPALLDEARRAASGSGDPRRSRDVENACTELERLLPEVIVGTKHALQDRNAQPELDRKVAEMDDALSRAAPPLPPRGSSGMRPEDFARQMDDIANAIHVPPEQQTALNADRLADNYAAVGPRASSGDRPGVAEATRAIAEGQPALIAEARREAAACGDPRTQDEVAEACRSLDQLGPRQAGAGKQLLDDPHSPEKRAECDRNARAARTALDCISDALCPPPELAAGDAEREVRKAMEDYKRALGTNDPRQTKRAYENLDPKLVDLRNNAELVALAEDPTKAKQARDAVRNLNERINAMRGAEQAFERDPSARNRAEAERRLKELQDALDELDRLIDIASKAPAERLKHELDLMQAASDRRDAPGATKHAKEAATIQPAVIETAHDIAGKAKSPETRKRADQIAKDLEAMLPETLQSLKEALKGPQGQLTQADDELRDNVQEMKDKITELEGLADAGTRKGDAAAAIARAHYAADALAKAAKANDGAGAQKASQALKAAGADLRRAQANKPPGWAANPELVSAALDDFDKLSKEALSASPAVGRGDRNANQKTTDSARAVHEPLDRLWDLLNGDKAPAAHARDRIKGLAAHARKCAAEGKPLDLEALLRASKELADSLLRFSDAARTAACRDNDMSGGAGAAGKDLLDLVDRTERGRGGSASSGAQGAASGGGRVAQEISRVANEIDTAVARHKREVSNAQSCGCIDVSALTDAMKRLAEAARNGQREHLVVTAREIAALIAKICAELEAVADRCRDPRFKDRIKRSLMALRNFSVQLKIVAAVKAATKEGECGEVDEQVICVVNSIGISLNESLVAVQNSKKAGLMK
eukprot:m51a1_g10547 hypothetical protein (1163) ;mRNA; r:26595-30557